MNWISNLLRKTPQPKALPIRPVEALGPKAPTAGDPPEAWVAAICEVADKALALAWTEKLSGDVWLGEVAQQARSAETRYAAVLRIDANAVLERVAQACRDKDKRVYRHCADLLRQRREKEAATGRAQEIAAELHELLACAPLCGPHLLDLKKQADALGQAGADLCHDLLERGMTRVREEAEARRDLQVRQRAAVSLAAECEHPIWPWNEQIETWAYRLDAFRKARLPDWLASDPAASALTLSLGEIEARLSALALEAEQTHACEQFLTELEDQQVIDAAAMATWEAMIKPEHASPTLAVRWEDLLARNPVAPVAVSAPVAIKAPRKPAIIDLESVRDQLDRLGLLIEQGLLVEADAAMKPIKTALAGHRLDADLAQRLHDLQAKLESLRGWARWGTGQAREQLIASALELQSGEHDASELALAIPALREAWKQLNAHGPSSKAQWESFDAALELAYQPVATLRAEQAARQLEALAAKEALCLEWEVEIAGIAWEQADFKAVEAARTRMLQRWRTSPQAGFRAERILRKRFDTLIAAIDSHLEQARTHERERREQLIAQAESLIGLPDLKQAMAEAKSLQGRWSSQAVRLKRSDEVKLWQRFRAACDAVFARLEALRTEQSLQRQQRAVTQQTLLDALDATLKVADANGIRQALARFREEWDAVRDASDRLDARARELQNQAQQRLEQLRAEQNRKHLELFALKAALAERVEAVALAAGPVEAAQAEANAAWSGLPALPAKADGPLAQRLAKASQINPLAIAAGSETRKDLLLELEMALGLPSPEAYAAIRRDRQLERLQRHFGADSAADPEAILLKWYATAALPDADMDRRILLVVKQLAARA